MWGLSNLMQPVKLGALMWCLVTSALLGMLVLAPPSRAQTVLGTPQQTNDRISAFSSTARLSPHDYIIGKGDLIVVDIFDVKELSREVRVSQTGSIGLPLLPVRLRVAGLTEIQAEQKIAEVLEANGLVSHPQVSVSVKERKSKPITVVGAVQHPVVYQADRPVTILEALAEAGGIANDAGDTVIVTRPSQEPSADSSELPAIGAEDHARPTTPKASTETDSAPESASSTGSASNSSAAPKTVFPAPDAAESPNAAATPPAPNEPPHIGNTITINLNELVESGNAANNIMLQGGDIITVPHAGIAYILGAVSKPGGYVMANDRTQMSTLKLLALSGGLSRTAKMDRAVIIRKDNQGQQHEVAVDLKKVLERTSEDVLLQPSDILYVPNSGSKQAMYKALELGIAVGTGVALYRLAYH
jgi:polysaccharide export outer membrane protein